MVNKAILEVPELIGKVFVTLMPYPNYADWHILKNLFDVDRTWAFTGYKDAPDAWELEKAKFFSEQKENFIFIPIDTKDISGTEIREALNAKDYRKLESYLMPSTLEIIKRINSTK